MAQPALEWAVFNIVSICRQSFGFFFPAYIFCGFSSLTFSIFENHRFKNNYKNKLKKNQQKLANQNKFWLILVFAINRSNFVLKQNYFAQAIQDLPLARKYFSINT